MKTCSNKECKNPNKHKSEFYRKAKARNGLQSWCKDCAKSKHQLYYSAPERKAATLAYDALHWAQKLLRSAKGSSKTRGMPVPSITEGDIIAIFNLQNKKCYWTGVTMTPSIEARNLYQPSLDRLDPNKGYDPGNVVLCCWAANAARCDSSPVDFRGWLESVRLNS